MRSLRDVRAIVAGSAVAAVLAGCANIWGFEAAVDLTEGGPDSASEAMVGTMGMPSDGGADASFASDAAGPCTCVPAPPTNWGGPFAIYESAGSLPALPNCMSAGVYSSEVYAGTGSLDAGPAECTCVCDPLSATCGPAVMSFFSDGMCTQACSPATQAIG